MPIYSRRVEKLIWDHRRKGDDPWAVIARLYQMMWEVRSQRDRLEEQLERKHEDRAVQRLEALKRQKQAVVYYVEREPGGLIKIGRTVQLQSRLQDLRCGLPELTLLALEPGGPNTEARRHRQFAELREAGEWFKPDPKLLKHIEKLAAQAYDPAA